MMRLNLNRLIIRRGSIVEINWDTTGMTYPELIIRISGKETTVPVETSGSKKIRINGTTFKNVISLRATDNTGQLRRIDRSIYVYGKEKTDSYTRITPLRQYADYVKRFWRGFSKDQRRLYIILVFLMTTLIFVSSHPEIAKLLLIGAIGYVIYSVFKR